MIFLDDEKRMLYYLYVSKFKFPEFQNPKLINYNAYELELNQDFIAGLALACYQITKKDYIYKYLMISEDNKEVFSVYEYAELVFNLDEYQSTSQSSEVNTILSYKGLKNGLPYIRILSNDFLNGWLFVFQFFGLDESKYCEY